MLKDTEYHYTIKNMPADSRPRERITTLGAASLSNTELLAILLRTGTPEYTVLELAAKLLSHPGGLRYLAEATPESLGQHKGIGMAKVAQIKAAIELGKRVVSMSPEARPVIKCPDDVAHLVMEEMRFLDREHFRALCLNTKNQVISIATAEIKKGFELLDDLKNNYTQVLDLCEDIKYQENQGDHRYRKAVADLFEFGTDPIEVIKWKEVYEHLETALDHCEDVANLLKGVALKYV